MGIEKKIVEISKENIGSKEAGTRLTFPARLHIINCAFRLTFPLYYAALQQSDQLKLTDRA